jgi:predicted PurR-regulated permease PerM
VKGPGSRVGADLARITFGVLALALLLGLSLWVLRPFLGPTLWATMVVVATWPLMRRIEAAAGQRRWVAVTAMTLLLLLLFVVPLVLAIATIVGNADRLLEWGKLATTWRPPETPPEWLRSLPLVGGLVESLWAQLAAMGLRDVLPRLSPYAGDLTRWFVAEVGNIGVLVLQFLLTVLIAAVMYAHGEEAARQVRLFAQRLGGERGDGVVVLAGNAIRGVALGVGGTALVQSALGALGLVVAGIPAATLLTAVMFMLCIAQVGPVPVLLGASAWAYWGPGDGGGNAIAAVGLVVWALIVGTIDNVVRPWLIQMGADLPFLLIFAGVVGGLFAFGLVGIFVGPVVLAVGYTLLEAWVQGRDDEAPAPAPPEYRD